MRRADSHRSFLAYGLSRTSQSLSAECDIAPSPTRLSFDGLRGPDSSHRLRTAPEGIAAYAAARRDLGPAVIECASHFRLLREPRVAFPERGCLAPLPRPESTPAVYAEPLTGGAKAAAKCRNLSGLRTTYSARMTSSSISNAAVCTTPSDPSTMTPAKPLIVAKRSL